MGEELRQALIAAVEQMTVGDPRDDGTNVGPLSSIHLHDDVVVQVEKAVSQGATRLTGGTKFDQDGAWMAPAVLAGVTRDMDAYSEEIFGPVGGIYEYDSLDEALAIANESSFGFAGSVWAKDTERAE